MNNQKFGVNEGFYLHIHPSGKDCGWDSALMFIDIQESS